MCLLRVSFLCQDDDYEDENSEEDDDSEDEEIDEEDSEEESEEPPKPAPKKSQVRIFLPSLAIFSNLFLAGTE